MPRTKESERQHYLENRQSILIGHKEYYLSHREQICARHKLYYQTHRTQCLARSQITYQRKRDLCHALNIGKRQTELGTAKVTGVFAVYKNLTKRPYPVGCEVCASSLTLKGKPKRLFYHHWDNGNLSKGIWLCYSCHHLAEGIDKELEIKYKVLKKDIEKQYLGGMA